MIPHRAALQPLLGGAVHGQIDEEDSIKLAVTEKRAFLREKLRMLSNVVYGPPGDRAFHDESTFFCECR